jgi:hypothetical protein
MPPFVPDKPLRRGISPVPVFRDVPLRREPFIPPLAGVEFPEFTWRPPIFLDIPPRRWAQLFPAGPAELWQPYLEILPAGPMGRWERSFPVLRGGPSRQRQRLSVFSAGPTRRDERLVLWPTASAGWARPRSFRAA